MAEKIQKSNVQEIFELSMVQKGMLFHYLRESKEALYNVQLSITLKGHLNVDSFQKALNRVQSDNDILRSVFRWDEVDKPLQIILKDHALDLLVIDLSDKPDKEQRFSDHLLLDQSKRFDLTQLPLRVQLIKISNDEYRLIITHHHILYDGWSTGILLTELFRHYNDLSTEGTPETRLKPSYKQFYKAIKDSRSIEISKSYWENYLEGYEIKSTFSTNVSKDTLENKMEKNHFKTSLEKIDAFSARHHVTKAAVIYSAYGILLQKYNNTSDIVFGTTVSDRDIDLPGNEFVMGNFINTIPLRVRGVDGSSLLKMVEDLNRQLIKRSTHNGTSYFEIKNLLKLSNTDNLFDSLVVVENYPLDYSTIDNNDHLSAELQSVYENASLPLALTVFFKDQLEVEVVYKTGFITSEKASSLANHFFKILDTILSSPEEKLCNVSLLNKEEEDLILKEFNKTEYNYPKGDTIVSLFEKQVKANSNGIALVIDDHRISYKELNTYANVIANKISSAGMGKGDKVGLLFKPSVEMIAGILGVIKAGGIYVPLSPDAPTDRNKFILSDCSAKILLIQKNIIKTDLKSELAIDNDKIISINLQELTNSNEVHFQDITQPDDLIYTIYTSGTTGTPKGVEVFHRGLVNYINWRITDFSFTSKDVTLQLVSYYFDGYGANLYSALLSGGRLVLLNEQDRLNPQKIASTIKNEGISYVGLTPSIYGIVLSELESQIDNLALRLVVIAGEKASPDLLDRSIRLLPQVVLCNEYGPTETSIGATFNFGLNKENISIIGRPIHNTVIYIVDNNNRLLPVGLSGELCIGGVGVSNGYVNNQELTDKKFISSPFKEGERIYKTGDLACWLPDGNIQFLGRVDNQVKIKGYRIELEEIENQLNDYISVSQGVIVVKNNDAGKYLVGYYVSEVDLSTALIREHMAAKLPDYMVPSYFVRLDVIPLTPNGKVDKKILPDPDLTSENTYVIPRNDKEKLLASVWSDVLGVENIGIKDNFFLVGGDSIKSIQISSRMRREGYMITVKEIFNYPTIEELSAKLKSVTSYSDQQLIQGDADLSPIQQWFFDGKFVDKHHFNQSVLLNFPEGISEETVRKVFGKLIEHHDALRTVFPSDGHKIIQRTRSSEQSLSLEVFECSDLNTLQVTLSEESNKLQSGIDIQNGPLLKLALFHSTDGSRLLVVIHHLVIDGISWRILYEDIDSLYQQDKKGLTPTLPLKTDSFQSWPGKLLSYTETNSFVRAFDFWNSVAVQPVDSLLRDYKEGSNVIKDHLVESLKLDTTETKLLLGKAHYPFNTQINDLLLVGLLISVNEKYDVNKLKIDLEGHGREELNANTDISRTIGWFTSIYPVILNHEQGDFSLLIKKVKEVLRSVPNNGIDYLLTKHLEDSSLLHKEEYQAQISFNYLGQFDTDLNNNSFEVSSEDRGLEVSPNIASHYDWSFSGQVINGQLELSIRYSSKQYDPETIRELMDLYRGNLLKVIRYCDNYSKTELSPSDFSFKSLSIDQVDELQQKYDLEDIYALSPMQEGMLFHYMLDRNSEQYFEQKRLSLLGKVDVLAIEKSLNDLVQRYEVLRTIFLSEGLEQPLQLVLKDRRVAFNHIDIREQASDSIDTIVRSYQERDKNLKFNLHEDVLLRVTLLQIAEDKFEFIWSQHHIVMDGWCSSIIWSDFRTLYYNHFTENALTLPVTKKYSEYIHWLGDNDQDRSLDYWNNYLAGFENRTVIPKSHNILSSKRAFDLQTSGLQINAGKTKQLQEISRKHGVTLNSLFQTAWAILLSRYNNTEDVVFGAVVSGRPSEIEGVESIVGLFINTIPVRINVNHEHSLKELLKQVQSSALESEQHHYCPLSSIQAKSSLGTGLLDHILVFENFPVSGKIEGVSLKERESGSFEVEKVEAFEQTNYDLTVMIIPGEEISIKFDYNSNTYQKETVENVNLHLEKIIDEIIHDSQKVVKQISIISEAEKEQILTVFNDTACDYPKENTIVDLFKLQVTKTPNNIALKVGEDIYSYRQLDEKSNRIANYLVKEKKVQPGDLVGLMLERDEYLIASIFGILKAGAVYVPISPKFPSSRIEEIVEDSGLKMMITKDQYRNTFIQHQKIMVCVDLEEEAICRMDAMPPQVTFNSSDLAYIIYTSGSTGKPKGVMIEHHSVINRIQWMQKQYPLTEKDVIIQKTPIVFDVSVWELFWWSFTGASLCLLEPEGEKNPNKLISTIRENGVTTMHFVPSMLAAFLTSLNDDFDYSSLQSLRQIFSSGEALKPEHVNSFGELLHTQCNTRLINLYGPTEATVDVSYYECSFNSVTHQVPIGKPIDNTSLFILDGRQEIVPIGVIGELHIAGVGLARGYLHQHDLTEEKFISNVFIPGQKLYKTGDLARWNSNGDIEYMGRIDNQVKIRGYRIELGEIEVKLAGYDQINETAVLNKGQEGSQYLVAYYTSDEEIVPDRLSTFLSSKLPDYMVPQYYMHMSEMPLSSNGKLDRKALPEPNIDFSDDDIKPVTNTEKKLALIWSTVLNTEQELIGVNKNFFVVGGDSIKAIRLLSAINKEFNSNLELLDIFENTTIRLQSERLKITDNTHVQELIDEVFKEINEMKSIASARISDINDVEDIYPMSDIEKGMLFHSFLDSEQAVYHDQFVYNIPWSNFDLSVFEKAITLLIQKHAILRTSFNLNEYEEPISIVHTSISPNIAFQDISSLAKNEQEDTIQGFMESDRSNPFDAKVTPLWRAKIYQTSSSGVCLLFVFHHAILDGWSVASLITELNNTYVALLRDQLFKPRPLEVNYRDYVAREIAAKRNDDIRDYWNRELQDFSKLEIRDFFIEGTYSEGNEHFQRSFSSQLFKQVSEYSHQYGVGVKEMCFSAYLYALKTLTNSPEILVGLVSNNRLPIEGGDEVLGCFLNTIPFRLNIPSRIEVQDLLTSVRDKTLEIKKYQQLSFFEIQNVIGKSGSADNSLFDTIFNFVDFHIYDKVEYQSEKEITPENDLEISSYEKTNTDIDFTVSTFNKSMKISAAYSGIKYSREYMERFFDLFESVLSNIVNERTLSIGTMVKEDEVQELVHTLNDTIIGYNKEKTIIELFDEQVMEQMDRTALNGEDLSLTYSELKELSEKIASYLIKANSASPGSLIGVMLGHDSLFVPAILGVLRAGCTYVPIDPEYPENRIQSIIEDAGLDAIIVKGNHLIKSNHSGLSIVDLEDTIEEIHNCDVLDDFHTVESSNPAYIIYTSGSTGKPKGTLIPHYSVSRVVKSTNYIEIRPEDRIIQLSNTAFDGSVFDIYGALLNGAELVLMPKETLSDIRKLGKLIDSENISVMFITTALFNVLVEYSLEYLGSLRKVLFGGERISISHTERALSHLGKDKLIHVYGPTESTVFATFHPINEVDHKLNNVPIGLPISNTAVYVLDENMEIVPKGAAGEICISGDGLALGYLNQENLTHEKFQHHPFIKGERLYRTGDLARRLQDGSIEFLGRIDDQVKLRGFRIELGEIENQLSTHKLITENRVLVVDNDGDKYLVAYYVSDDILDINDLKNHLSKTLPDYMIPAAFLHMESLPLNSNGKLNKKALPEVEVDFGEEYVAPTNKTEEELVAIWAEVLKLSKAKIGINANFFDIGGHSINIIKLNGKVNEHFGTDISVANMFRLPTIALLADYIENGDQSVEVMSEEIDAVLADAEDTLNFLDQFDD